MIWQGDANSACLQSLALCQSPTARAESDRPRNALSPMDRPEFGRHFGVEPEFTGEEAADSPS